jgi:hypothetical protein
VKGFLETSSRMGTLDEILEGSGYRRKDGAWEPPEFVAFGREKAVV